MKGARIVDTKAERYMRWLFSVYYHESAIPNLLFFPHTGPLPTSATLQHRGALYKCNQFFTSLSVSGMIYLLLFSYQTSCKQPPRILNLAT
ncbi:hypothetical protein Hdeb2414_s0002g00047301 [Helianthus debilis subsp. tardiflorus]